MYWAEFIFYYGTNWLTLIQKLKAWAQPETNFISFYLKIFYEEKCLTKFIFI